MMRCPVLIPLGVGAFEMVGKTLREMSNVSKGKQRHDQESGFLFWASGRFFRNLLAGAPGRKLAANYLRLLDEIICLSNEPNRRKA